MVFAAFAIDHCPLICNVWADVVSTVTVDVLAIALPDTVAPEPLNIDTIPCPSTVPEAPVVTHVIWNSNLQL
jgi:hypothetical protein